MRGLTLFSALTLALTVGLTACADEGDEAGETTDEIGVIDENGADDYNADITVEGDADGKDWNDDLEAGADKVGDAVEDGADALSDIVDDKTEDSN